MAKHKHVTFYFKYYIIVNTITKFSKFVTISGLDATPGDMEAFQCILVQVQSSINRTIWYVNCYKQITYLLKLINLRELMTKWCVEHSVEERCKKLILFLLQKQWLSQSQYIRFHSTFWLINALKSSSNPNYSNGCRLFSIIINMWYYIVLKA